MVANDHCLSIKCFLNTALVHSLNNMLVWRTFISIFRSVDFNCFCIFFVGVMFCFMALGMEPKEHEVSVVLLSSHPVSDPRSWNGGDDRIWTHACSRQVERTFSYRWTSLTLPTVLDQTQFILLCVYFFPVLCIDSLQKVELKVLNWFYSGF